MQRAEPIAEFRMAFPSMFSSDTVALPGTSAGASADAPKKDPGDKKGKKPKAGDKRDFFDPGVAGPGSKSKLAMSLTSTELWLGGVVFHLDKIAQHYKMTNPDHLCWPVLLSKKKGDSALEVCPDHVTHGDMKQVCHKRPNNFDLTHIYKNFTRGASAAENNSAGWEKPGKRNKKN